ncbi:sugar ABC transporter ATP-binding protein [Lichenicola sp.]|uniref:sugar ABC transporter ATP-binding protein n=1 Tax=Lichenicola sp. TaxID=2804529 RepID=UPI003AFF63F8
MQDAKLRLQVQDVTKTFPGVRALSAMSLRVRPGEVHALLGENGAGKSTLLKTISGVQKPDSGTVSLDGRVLTLDGPLDARRAGIAMIHQELQQVPELTVAQNMFLGRPLRRGLFTDRAQQEAKAAAVLQSLDPAIRPDAPIRTLKVAQRQIVEIGRALLENAQVIAMDEPTSSLTPSEFLRLAEVIADLSASGVSIIYVSHKMDEVFRVCSRATVMRDGQLVGELDLAETTESAVVNMMVGRTLAAATHSSFATTETVLSVRNLGSGTKVLNASFDLHRGEVLGIAGLIGAGRTELLRLVAGADRSSSGTVTLNGRRLSLRSTRSVIAAGIGLVPEERKRDGIVPQRSVVNNIALSSMSRFAPRGLIRRRALRKRATEILTGINLRPMQIDRPIRLFSGGNQQKAIIARWIAADTQVLLFDEPTRGIDIGAKAEIYALIERLAAEGRSMIVVSSELPEILRVADRVLVMRQGRIAAELGREELSEQAIVAHAIPQSAADPGLHGHTTATPHT